MSVPTVFYKDPLVLSGHKISVVNSLNIKSIAPPRSNIYQQSQIYSKSDVLPSITPSTRESSAKSFKRIASTCTPTFTNINASMPILKLTKEKDVKQVARETNVLYEEEAGLVTTELLRYRSAPEPKAAQDVSEDGSISSAEENDHPVVKEFLADPVTDVFKIANTKDVSGKPRTKSAKKPRSSKKKKKRPKSKMANHGKQKSLPVENVYMDTSLLKRNTEICQLEAYCSPVNVNVGPFKTRKPMVDYFQHASSKAPCAPKILQNKSYDKPNVVERTKEFMATLTSKQNIDPPEYLKNNREFIQKFQELQNSVYGQKLTARKPATINLNTSAECISFRPAPSKPMHYAIMRNSLGSAPGEEIAPRVTKIYQSDKQSADMEEMGAEFPCPPPASPVEVMMKNIEFVPCMSDIRSQRSVKMRLEALVKLEKQRKEKIREEKQRLEKINQREKARELRKQQRKEIYALNKKMTELENKNFRSFCEQHGITCKE